MQKKYVFLISIAFVFCGLLSSQSFAHHGNIKICNASNGTKEVAFLWRNAARFWDNTWGVKGWYELPAGSCRVMVDGFGAAFDAYIAVAKQGLIWGISPAKVKWEANLRIGRNSKEKFCVRTSDDFRRNDIPLQSHKSCPGGYEIFSYVV